MRAAAKRAVFAAVGFLDNLKALLPGRRKSLPPVVVGKVPALSEGRARAIAFLEGDRDGGVSIRLTPDGAYEAIPSERLDVGPGAAPSRPRSAGDFTSSLRKDPSWVDSIGRAALPAAGQKVPDDERIGGPGTTIRFGRIQHEEFNLDLENEKGIGDGFGVQGVFDKMRKTDPEVHQTLSLLKFPLLCATPKIEPGDASELAAEIATFVSYNLFELNPWQPQIRQALLMYDFGFSVFETLFGNREVPRARFPNLPQGELHPKGVGEAPGPGRPALDETVTAVCLTACDLRHPKTIFQWAADPDRPTQLRFVVQRLATDDTEEATFRRIPVDRLMRFTHDQEAGNFAGVSAIRAAYKPWRIKETLEEIDAIRHERQNVGIAVLKQPAEVNTKELDKLEEILGRIGSFQGSWMSLPHGYEFAFETSGQGEGTRVEAALERCTREIADAICAGFMTLGNGDTGSYAMADVQKDAGFENAIEAGARLIEHGYNHGFDGWSVIKRIVDANYGPQPVYPRFRLTNLRNGMLALMAKLLVAGGITSDKKLRDYIRANLNLPAEGEIDPRVEDDPRDTKKQIAEEYEAAPEEGPPGKTPMTPVPGDGAPRVKPGPVAPAPIVKPAQPAAAPPTHGAPR